MQTGYGESSFQTAEQKYGSQSWGQQYGGQQISPGQAAVEFLQVYSRERPEVVVMWAFGIGFILGWKLKPW